MALITNNKFERIEKVRNLVHNETQSTYTTFSKYDNKFFQIDTYGSDNRKFKNKISQSIQLDKNMAIEIIEILRDEFDL